MNRRYFLAGAGGVAAYSMFGGHPLQGAAASPITVAATGDCILSRRVSHLKDQGFLDVVQLLRSADCAYGNCELVMAAGDQGYPTAAGSSLSVVVDPKMAEELAWLGYDLMGTANNHSTDYGVEGVRSTIANLERAGIGYAGTGMNLQQAAAPGYADTPGGRVALINGEDADNAPGPSITVGSTVTWRYVVTNTGTTNLTAIAVVDDRGVSVNCSGQTLPAGQTMTCTGTGVATLGQYSNIGKVTANSTSGSVDDSDPSHYLGITPTPPVSGEMTICHIPPGNYNARHTITIDPSAWPAHQGHCGQGTCDYIGSCR